MKERTIGQPIMDDNFVAYQSHIRFINFVFKAGLVEMIPITTRGLLHQLRYNWLWLSGVLGYITYLYIMFFEPLTMEELSGVIWTSFALVQTNTKGLNALCLNRTLQQLFDWNKRTNNPRYEPEFSRIVENRIAESDKWIGRCITLNASLTFVAALVYIIQPILMREFVTPTPIRIAGQSEFPLTVFLIIYAIQAVLGYSSIIYIIGYESVFILLISAISGRFRTISDILDTLKCQKAFVRDHVTDRRTLIKCHLMHLDVLE